MPRTCTVHRWSHPTESCPYCREIGSRGTDTARAERLSAAIVAAISGDTSKVTEHYTQDVVGSGLAISVSSREELATEIEERGSTFSDVDVALSPLPVSGHQAAVEWVASATHTGPLMLPENRSVDVAATGRRVRVRAITVAEFDGEQICSFRSYWDELPLLRELLDARTS